MDDKREEKSCDPQIDVLKIQLGPEAIMPTRATEHSAGLDLYSPVDVNIDCMSSAIIDMCIRILVPLGCYGQLLSKSSLAKKNINVQGGVIDGDYTGTIRVVLYNNNHSEEEPFCIKRGDAIAQLICQQISIPKVKLVNDLHTRQTSRGEQGFGALG